MRFLNSTIFGVILVFLASCATTTSKFPLSATVPAAEITAKKKQDKNNNYTLDVEAKNLASAERLNPPKETYVVWIVTDDNMTRNVGQLMIKNAKTSSLKTSTPFNVKQVFITAENQGDVTYPSGIEISRTSFDK